MSDISETMYGWLEEAVQLRFGADDSGHQLYVPDYAEGPAAFVGQLLAARQRADRVEELLGKAKRAQRRLAARRNAAADAAQDRLDAALVEGNQSKVEFSTGLERKAEASLKSFEEKRAEREAQRMLAVADEVVDAIKDAHWGLSGWRNDMRDIVRSFQLESNLER